MPVPPSRGWYPQGVCTEHQSRCAKLMLGLGEVVCQSVKKQLLGCVAAECCAENSFFQGTVEYKLIIKVCVCVFNPSKPAVSALPWLFLELSGGINGDTNSLVIYLIQ